MVPNFKFPKVQEISENSHLSPFINLLLLDEPFFAHIFRAVNFAKDEKVQTAGVYVREGDFNLVWSPEFMSSLSNQQVLGLLKHEAFHLVFQHCTKRRLEPHNVAKIGRAHV